MMMPNNQASFFRLIRGGLIASLVLLILDVAVYGTFISAIICPIWFIVSLVKAIKKRPGWKVGLSRIMIPALTLAIVGVNATLQIKIAEANAKQIVTACEQYRTDNGKFPDKLAELVPTYLSSVPRAKYTLTSGDFRYWNQEGSHQLIWDKNPPFGRMTYSFEQRTWRYHAD